METFRKEAVSVFFINRIDPFRNVKFHNGFPTKIDLNI